MEAGRILNGSNAMLAGARDITTFTSGDDIYAAVAVQNGDGVQILNVTNPYNVTAADSIVDNIISLELDDPTGITTFTSGGDTYAAVVSYFDDGVQILNITDPYRITAAGSITDVPGNSVLLDGARDIVTFESDSYIYAAVAAAADDGVQILNITKPYSITAVGNIVNTASLKLEGAWDISTFKSNDHVYVAVAANTDAGVQILDVTNPSSIVDAGNIAGRGTNIDDLEFNGIRGITTFKSGGHIHAAAAAFLDDGVQIIRIDVVRDTTPPVITLTGNDSVTVEANTTYDDAGAGCTDAVDGPITPTKTFDDVDTSKVGSYTVTYSCEDDAGNATTKSRIVIVEDTIPPVITILGANPATITAGSVYNDAGATCIDRVDGTLTPTLDSSSLDVNQAGLSTVTYSCADKSGNPAISVSRFVIVETRNTAAPVITLAGDAVVQLTVGDTYTELGANCEDDVDADKAATVGGATVDTGTAGQYVVTYNCTDAASNPAIQVIRTVNVVAAPDNAAPVITLAGDAVVQLTVGDTYTELGANCEDDVDADKQLIPVQRANTS